MSSYSEAAAPRPNALPLVTGVRLRDKLGEPAALCVYGVCDGRSELLSKANELFSKFSGGDKAYKYNAGAREVAKDEGLRRQFDDLGDPWCSYGSYGLWYKVDAFKREDGSYEWAVGVGRNKKQYERAWLLAITLAFAAEAIEGCDARQWPGLGELVEQARTELAATRQIQGLVDKDPLALPVSAALAADPAATVASVPAPPLTKVEVATAFDQVEETNLSPDESQRFFDNHVEADIAPSGRLEASLAALEADLAASKAEASRARKLAAGALLALAAAAVLAALRHASK